MESDRMPVERYDGPDAFLDAVRSYLLRDEARHNLLLGVAATAQNHPRLYPTFRGWIVRDSREIVGAASQTPPFSVIVARPARDGVLAALVDAWAAEGIAVTGLTGAIPEVREAAEGWATRTGASDHVRVCMGVFELTAVADVPRPAGGARPATVDDRTLVVEWLRRFSIDIGEGGAPAARDPRRIADEADRRLGADDAALWLWLRDGEPVSMAGYSGPTGTGIRVGPVFTPREHRGHGYATALVADLSAWLLDRGRRACFLYTDLANPTSNAIYERIGYRKVCEALDVTFAVPVDVADAGHPAR